jgi:hypothetical protein
MATLYQKFPGIIAPDTSIQVYPIAVKFTAPLIGGRFDFLGVENFAFTGNSSEKFILDGSAIAGNISNQIFNNALDPAAFNGFFLLDIIRDGNRHPVTLAPFKFSDYSQALNFSANFAPNATDKSGRENFNFKLSGGLLQTPEILALGLNSISIIITTNLYRISQRAMK